MAETKAKTKDDELEPLPPGFINVNEIQIHKAYGNIMMAFLGTAAGIAITFAILSVVGVGTMTFIIAGCSSGVVGAGICIAVTRSAREEIAELRAAEKAQETAPLQPPAQRRSVQLTPEQQQEVLQAYKASGMDHNAFLQMLAARRDNSPSKDRQLNANAQVVAHSTAQRAATRFGSWGPHIAALQRDIDTVTGQINSSVFDNLPEASQLEYLGEHHTQLEQVRSRMAAALSAAHALALEKGNDSAGHANEDLGLGPEQQAAFAALTEIDVMLNNLATLLRAKEQNLQPGKTAGKELVRDVGPEL